MVRTEVGISASFERIDKGDIGRHSFEKLHARDQGAGATIDKSLMRCCCKLKA
jgi:hypothetical protein